MEAAPREIAVEAVYYTKAHPWSDPAVEAAAVEAAAAVVSEAVMRRAAVAAAAAAAVAAASDRTLRLDETAADVAAVA